MVDEKPLAGRLAAIDPTIENGAVKFKVDLDEPRNPKLRNNLRVDVLVVTDSRANALRVPKGPFAQGGPTDDGVRRPGRPRRAPPVRFGLSGYDYYEVARRAGAGGGGHPLRHEGLRSTWSG